MKRTGLALLLGATVAAGPAWAAKPAKPPSTSTATLAAAPNLITVGASTTLTGHATGKRSNGATVTLQARPAPYTAAFKAVAKTTADATGHYTFKVAPQLNTAYHVVVKTTPQATSPDVIVKVRVRITLRVSTTTPAAGHRVRFFGVLAPAYNGRFVLIQRRIATGWKTIGRARLLASTASGGVSQSRYSKRIRVFNSGRYRARFNPRDGLRLANNSRSRKLTVH
jgi:hypothetical protein